MKRQGFRMHFIAGIGEPFLCSFQNGYGRAGELMAAIFRQGSLFSAKGYARLDLNETRCV
jgi:hypothetical protein